MGHRGNYKPFSAVKVSSPVQRVIDEGAESPVVNLRAVVKTCSFVL